MQKPKRKGHNGAQKRIKHTIREYTEQIKRSNNLLHSLGLLPVPSKDTVKSLQKIKQVLQKEVDGLEQKLEALLKLWQPAQLKSAGNIKGIGKRATAMLIVFTQGFKNTHNHRQLISFAGMVPHRIELWHQHLRQAQNLYKRRQGAKRCTLYVATSAIKTNVACKALYERLKAAGKTGKQALIAVCNKLLKQVFAPP